MATIALMIGARLITPLLSLSTEMGKYDTYIRGGRSEIHRDRAIVERFNRTLAERLFGHQYAVEMLLPEEQRSTAWVRRLPDVVAALNNEVTSLIGKKPAVAIKEKAVSSKPSTKYSRPVEGGTKRATDPIWSLKVHQIKKLRPNQMSLSSIICLTGLHAASFVRSC